MCLLKDSAGVLSIRSVEALTATLGAKAGAIQDGEITCTQDPSMKKQSFTAESPCSSTVSSVSANSTIDSVSECYEKCTEDTIIDEVKSDVKVPEVHDCSVHEGDKYELYNRKGRFREHPLNCVIWSASQDDLV